jgi:DNA-binding NarL/FixJ family response regulator
MPRRILLADDCPTVRRGVRSLLEREDLEVVGEADNGREAVVLASLLQPDVAVLDWSMPELNGLEAARQIHRCCATTRVVLLTVHTSEDQIVEAMRAGVLGYVVKAEAPEHLVAAIAEVLRGRIYVSPAASRVLVEALLPLIGVAT